MKLNDDLIINSATKKQLEAYLMAPVHALLLFGEPGVGLGSIARYLAKKLSGSNVIEIAPTIHKNQVTNIINADDVSEIGSLVRSKRTKRLTILIDGVDQTAPGVFEHLLKLIEEPTPNINYLFTAHVIARLPDTILSRCGQIRVLSPSANQTNRLIEELPASERTKIAFIASGLPAEINRLINDQSYRDTQMELFTKAKQFLVSSPAERINIINDFSDRREALEFCRIIARLLTLTSLKNPPNHIAASLDAVNKAIERLSNNGNYKLQLLSLVWRV